MSFNRTERKALETIIHTARIDKRIDEARCIELLALVERESADTSHIPSAAEQQRYLELATDPTVNGATGRYILAGRPGDIETFTRQLAADQTRRGRVLTGNDQAVLAEAMRVMREPALELLESAPSEPADTAAPKVAMITPGSTWTLALCNDAASKAVAEHGLVVHGYIVGSAYGSAVRFHLLREGVVVLHVQLGIDELEACGDEAAVRAAVTGRIAGVIESARECGYDVLGRRPS